MFLPAFQTFEQIIVEKLVVNLARKKIIIGETEVLILGYTFKENCNDFRNTKVYDIIENLKQYNMKSKF